MNWLSALQGAQAPNLTGTVREHRIWPDSPAYHSRRKELIAKPIQKPKIKAKGRGSGWAKGAQFVPRMRCKLCDKLFYAPPSYLKRGQGKYCGRECWAKSLRK